MTQDHTMMVVYVIDVMTQTPHTFFGVVCVPYVLIVHHNVLDVQRIIVRLVQCVWFAAIEIINSGVSIVNLNCECLFFFIFVKNHS